MPYHEVSASAEIAAPAERVYATIADYHVGHPAILPKHDFISLDVEEGGIGAGTIIRVRMKVFGLTGTFRAVITEPEPGRLLEETDLANGRVTSFLVEPTQNTGSTRVTITTRSQLRKGLLGKLESRMIERMLRPIFERELAQLGEVVGEKSGAGDGA